MRYIEVQRNLFTVPSSYSLAQCISADCVMGAGIAKQFVKRYPLMKGLLKNMNPAVGQVLIYHATDHTILNMVTKKHVWNKPTYVSFNQTVHSLKDACQSLGITKLAIPLIGAGLDKLDWEENRRIIQSIFSQMDIDILVCRR